MRRFLFIFVSMSLCIAAASAQERYGTVVRRNPWNMGGGVAGLRCDSVSVSYAEAYACKENGGFIPTYGSADSWSFGAGMESLYHLEKVSFCGGFGYDCFYGRDMCGSMFTHPGYYPVDILEFTPGNKMRETYSFRGGVSAELGRGLRLGLSADLSAESYSKRKDLRHKNNALDLTFMPSATYAFRNGAVGVTYIFAKRGENVAADEYGISSLTYDAFFDKGLCYGVRELWTGSGIHLQESGISGFPVREFANGAMLQAQWGAVYADVSYRRGEGRTGEKSTIWHEFSSDAVDAHIAATLRGRWYVRGGFGLFSQTNRENVLKAVTENGVTTTRKFGSNDIFSRRMLRSMLETEYAADRWWIVAGAEYVRCDRLSTLMYPEYRRHSMSQVALRADSRVRLGRFELSAGARGRFGGSDSSEGVVADGVESGEYPSCLEDYLSAETEYFTAAAAGVVAGLRCDIKAGFYVDLQAEYTHAFATRFVGADRVRVRLAVGYGF